MERSSRTMTTEWSFPRLNLCQSSAKRKSNWREYVTVVVAVITILTLVPVLFCLVLIAMGAETLTTLLLSLICAALVLIVNVMLFGVWGTISLLPSRWKKITLGVSAGMVTIGDGIYGCTTWIVLVLNRNEIRDPLDSLSGMLLSRERIIAAGFACWVVMTICQVIPVMMELTKVAFLICLVRMAVQLPFDPSTQVRSSALSSTVLSPSSSVIPMRRATVHHHPSISSLAPSHFSHRPTQSLSNTPTSPYVAPPPAPSTTMPIINLSSPTFKSSSPLNDFPLPPSTTRTTGSISSLQIFPPTDPFPRTSLHSTSSLPTLRTSSDHPRPKRLSKTLFRPDSPRKPFSPRKRFKSDETFPERSAFDDWNPEIEDPGVRERVEMSFESVRMEKDVQVGLGMRLGVGTPRVGDRNVSNGSEGWSPLTPVMAEDV